MPSVKVKIKDLNDLERLSKYLLPFLKPNIYLILIGELGVGKTTLTQLIAKNLGIKSKITSPTFTVFAKAFNKKNYYLNHFDFFRLNENDSLSFFQELTVSSLSIIEWGEKNTAFWQAKKHIRLELIKKNTKERLVFYLFFCSKDFSDEKIWDT